MGDSAARWGHNTLRWNEDDGEGLVVGADFGFFRLEAEGTYQDGAAVQWRDHAATDGTVHQFRLFGNVVAEPFDCKTAIELGLVDTIFDSESVRNLLRRIENNSFEASFIKNKFG